MLEPKRKALQNYFDELEGKVGVIMTRDEISDALASSADEFWHQLDEARMNLAKVQNDKELGFAGDAYVDSLNELYRKFKEASESVEAKVKQEPAQLGGASFTTQLDQSAVKRLKLTGNSRPIRKSSFRKIQENANEIRNLKQALLNESTFMQAYERTALLLKEIRDLVGRAAKQATDDDVEEYFTFTKGLTAILDEIYRRLDKGESMCNETDVAVPIQGFLEVNKSKFTFI